MREEGVELFCENSVEDVKRDNEKQLRGMPKSDDEDKEHGEDKRREDLERQLGNYIREEEARTSTSRQSVPHIYTPLARIVRDILEHPDEIQLDNPQAILDAVVDIPDGGEEEGKGDNEADG